MQMTWHAGLAAPPELPVRGGVSSAGSLSCQVETPLPVCLRSCGTVLPPLPGTPAVHHMRAGAENSTTDQSGAVGRCVLMQPPGQDHRWLDRGHSCQLVAELSLGVG